MRYLFFDTTWNQILRVGNKVAEEMKKAAKEAREEAADKINDLDILAMVMKKFNLCRRLKAWSRKLCIYTLF